MTDLSRPRPTLPWTAPRSGSARPSRSLVLVGIAVTCYAAFGKGFAYAGYPPVYVGEVVLAILLAGSLRLSAPVPRNKSALCALALAVLAGSQLIIEVVDGGSPLIEVVRSFAPIYYMLWALVVYWELVAAERRRSRAAVVDMVLQWYIRAGRLVVLVVPAVALLLVVQWSGVPHWPGSGVAVVLPGSTDISVALVAFQPSLRHQPSGRRSFLVGCWLIAAVLVAARSRAALLALVAGVAVSSLVSHGVTRAAARILKTAMVAAMIMLVLAVSGLSITVGSRELSARSIVESVQSVFGDVPEGTDLANTRDWRARWWSDIWNDVSQRGYILNGFGWADNLAVRYGVIPPDAGADPQALRYPHNIFFSLAGRAGLVVTGLFMAVPLLAVATMRRASRGASSKEKLLMEAATATIVGALLVAFTDVYLESPRGLVLFWTSLGLSWWLIRRESSP
jgi:hypothetical protein